MSKPTIIELMVDHAFMSRLRAAKSGEKFALVSGSTTVTLTADVSINTNTLRGVEFEGVFIDEASSYE